MTDPSQAVERLVTSSAPFLIGVRHHSAALAVAVPELLNAAAPDAVLVELPVELQEWLPWLAHPETTTPVALAIARPDGARLGFYPFADFSPELAALRWAAANGVPAHAIDVTVDRNDDSPRRGVGDLLRRHAGTDTLEAAWDRLVETPSYGADPERVRRAALAYGWAVRADADPVSDADLVRETHMRHRLREVGAARPAVVVGAFHAAAFVEPAPEMPLPAAREDVVTSLIPYNFALLDSRSGYPAGVRDPGWHQEVVLSKGRPEALDDAVALLAARVCARLRADGHVAGTPDAVAVYTMARELASLRGLPAPGRAELVEGLQSALAQGEPLGRARAVAKAAEQVLVGERRGRIAGEAPRSGLVAHVADLRKELRLPVRDRAFRLDPFRSPLDRRRHVAMFRMRAAGIDYAQPGEMTGVAGAESVTKTWEAHWTPASDATVELAGVYGPDLATAAEGRLTWRLRRGTSVTEILDEAAEAGLPELTARLIAEIGDTFPATAGLVELLDAYRQVHRIRSGGVPGIPTPPANADRTATRLMTTAVSGVDGYAGADSPVELAALRDLIGLADDTHRESLVWQLERMTDTAGPAAQGAIAAALVRLSARDSDWLTGRITGWVDAGGPTLGDRLRGVLVMAGPMLEASSESLTGLTERIGAWSPERFLDRLPALRKGFDTLSTAARDRLLATLELDAIPDTTDDPADLARWEAADRAGYAAVAAMLPAPAETPDAPAAPATAGAMSPETAHRWRLILGRQAEKLPVEQRRLARALDELYGRGHGEGSAGGGLEAPYPSAREWAEDLTELFGERVREEVLGAAAARGRNDVVSELDPERVEPSVDLLQNVLSLAGALPESRLAVLRPIVARIVDQLVKALATRMRPALTGLTVPRPTFRPTGRLDLSGTLRRNLHTARMRDDVLELAVERPVFHSRGNRTASWHIHLIVDVSGSMERSVIHSALTAAILHGVSALSITFTAFSTQVLDLSDRVSDPLSLLMEVSIGGGTDIGKAVAYTRKRLTVPSRSIVALITDFEEGGSTGRLLSEIRSLAETGAVLLGLAALDDTGVPVYNKQIAAAVAAAGMPVAALSPSELARWIVDQVNRR
ncbi:VWA domain containing CoxE-like protein [Stackebrandtia albiflava]|uniref:VWA domain containing CoxE-like protein n=1 Tax=Stackebrandtia albiflava TaxID=406432 RepID=A0A562UYU9_9ACTN|nr:DUF5682 family protein [Stackebrandtia albiflava]TWJ10821.1 VWA domain containing CoxE-like protein [Stackebrandtia albiflava]